MIGRKRLRIGLAVFAAIALLSWWQYAAYLSSRMPLPDGLAYASPRLITQVDQVEFLADTTGRQNDEHRANQMIFDQVFDLIADAEDFLLIDCFLWNDYAGTDAAEPHRNLSTELVDALLAKHGTHPDMPIIVISDPINEVYGGAPWSGFDRLRDAGIAVVLTDLTKLRDSNPAYSALWRTFIQPWGNHAGGNASSHPLNGAANTVTRRSWLALLNFKANHRKLIIADAARHDGNGREMVALIMSANPHDGSSAHSNVALMVRGEIWRHVAESEQAVLKFSSDPRVLFDLLPEYAATTADIVMPVTAPPDSVHTQLLTESAIHRRLRELFAFSEPEPATMDLALFYLSDRELIDDLVNASNQGAQIRIILDPNKDAFGYEKNGVPNRPVAAELVQRSNGRIQVRWFDTQGEQFHAKFALVRRQGRQPELMLGSANYTDRNLGDYNLETNVSVAGPADTPAILDAQAWFDRLWHNTDGAFTTDYDTYADDGLWHRWLYRIQEATGLSTF